MAKVMKSYRLSESDVFLIKDMSDGLGLTESDLIRLAIRTLETYSVDDILANNLDECGEDVWSKNAGIDGLTRVIDRSNRDGSISRMIRERIADVF